MNVEQLIRSPLVRSPDGVWLLENDRIFEYSDGQAHEKYLLSVCHQARDLSSDSRELEAFICDWPSEYHLSRRRANLLRSLRLDRESVVVEVGCGCGAITRFLGESFKEAVGIEGSSVRARIARARTRDLANTEIVAAPFQELDFQLPVDAVFCIGVYEYAGLFVSGSDPYHSMLGRMASMLRRGGYLVLAIENQFGLKYWNGCTEDHVGREFEGIEGYLSSGGGVRTFGRIELEAAIRKHFEDVRFFYPHPDYKVPSAVLAEEMLRVPGVSEVIAHLPERDYRRPPRRRMNRRHALREIERNGLLHLWSDSFLAVARFGGQVPDDVAPLGVLYSADRQVGFGSTTVFRTEGKSLHVEKTPELDVSTSWLRPRATVEKWVPGESLLMQAQRAVLRSGAARTEYWAVIRRWVEFVAGQLAGADGRLRSFDCTLDNIREERDSGTLVAIDDEWDCAVSFPINRVLIRGLCRFYQDVLSEPGGTRALHGRSVGWNVKRDLAAAGRPVSVGDFAGFLRLEASVSAEVYGKSAPAVYVSQILFLSSYRVYQLARRVHQIVRLAVGTVRELYWSLFLSHTRSPVRGSLGHDRDLAA
jgi:SAM-dependent methyltransferase